MALISQRPPLVAGLLGAIAVVAITMAFRDDPVEPSRAESVDPSASATAPVVATPSDSPALAAAATPFPIPTDQEALRTLGRRLVTAPDERPAAASFDVETASYADGSTFVVSGGEPNPITVVFFMAAWCPTCGPEAIALGELHERYAASGVQIIILDADQNETEDDLAGFRERTGEGAHLWAMDRDFNVARALEVNTLDTTVFIDQQGRIAYQDGSPTEYEVLAAVVEALLAEGA